jgi:hypothetical protein
VKDYFNKFIVRSVFGVGKSPKLLESVSLEE